ncbi:hypothetical protein FB45DRAFT_150407 [Roridomyces roridus]|uniref:Uncharacterized protein n=1 Tax=Roridomyces roridus TaxID=1738132 RepID=A0AAD7FID1_9AGAR|nr:hypothetical protein FB45DRAFT_150407 [Roridomyces roridus]
MPTALLRGRISPSPARCFATARHSYSSQTALSPHAFRPASVPNLCTLCAGESMVYYAMILLIARIDMIVRRLHFARGVHSPQHRSLPIYSLHSTESISHPRHDGNHALVVHIHVWRVLPIFAHICASSGLALPILPRRLALSRPPTQCILRMNADFCTDRQER